MATILIDVKQKGAAKTSKSLKTVDDSAKGLGTTFSSLGKIVGATALAFGGLRVLKDMVANASEAAAATASLEAVLKSTSGVAGVTKDAALSLSNELQLLTSVSDDAITSAQSLLLTFTKISKDVFPDTVKTVLDMSRAFGTDLKGASIQLGKALNDPITGISALSKVGVSFTATQKELIKAFVDVGDVASAQRIILDELAVEVGGAAEAYANTLPGALNQAELAVDDLSQAFGEELAPSIISASKEVVLFANALQEFGLKNTVALTAGIVATSITLGVLGSAFLRASTTMIVAEVAADKAIVAFDRLQKAALFDKGGKGVRGLKKVAGGLKDTGKAASGTARGFTAVAAAAKKLVTSGPFIGLAVFVGLITAAFFLLRKEVDPLNAALDEMAKKDLGDFRDKAGLVELRNDIINLEGLKKALEETIETLQTPIEGLSLQEDVATRLPQLIDARKDLARVNGQLSDSNILLSQTEKEVARAEEAASDRAAKALAAAAAKAAELQTKFQDALLAGASRGAKNRIAQSKATQDAIIAEEERGLALREEGFLRTGESLTKLEQQLGALPVPPALKEIREGLSELTEGAKLAKSSIESFTSTFTSTFASELFPSLRGLKESLSDAKDELKLLQDEGADNDGISRAAERVRELERELEKVSSFSNRFENAWKGAFDAVGQAFAQLVAELVAKAAVLAILNLIPGFATVAKASDLVFAANGFEGMVNSPTAFIVAEKGPEFVSVTPSGQSRAASQGSAQRAPTGGSVINITQNFNGALTDASSIEDAMVNTFIPAMDRINNQRGI